jgi:hypothetical protein
MVPKRVNPSSQALDSSTRRAAKQNIRTKKATKKVTKQGNKVGEKNGAKIAEDKAYRGPQYVHMLPAGVGSISFRIAHARIDPEFFNAIEMPGSTPQEIWLARYGSAEDEKN